MSIPAVDRLAFNHGISGNHAKRMLGLKAWPGNKRSRSVINDGVGSEASARGRPVPKTGKKCKATSKK